MARWYRNGFKIKACTSFPESQYTNTKGGTSPNDEEAALKDDETFQEFQLLDRRHFLDYFDTNAYLKVNRMAV